MKKFTYKNFYESVGRENGWDFSKVSCISEGETWDFYQEVSHRCRKTDILLDIGTGGGEKICPIADSAMLLIGIDQSAGMMETDLSNLAQSSIPNVRFVRMDAEKLDFPEGFFQVVSCRHAPFSSREVARVLAEDGVFLTQQVSEGDKFNITQAFGRSQFTAKEGTLRQKYESELKDAGFMDIQTFEYDATEFYKSYEDLVFLLKHTPIIPDFGKIEGDFAVLEKFIEDYQTSKGIETNAKRFMIMARK